MTNQSSYIESLPEADYQEVTGNGNRQLAGIYSSIIDLFPGGRGKAVTKALNVAGLSKSNRGLTQAYNANQRAIDHYFEQVNLNKVVKDILGQAKPSSKIMTPVLIGMGVGAVGMYFIKR
jgi:hypothetical protein